MKHIVSLSPQLELIYVEAAKVLDISIDEFRKSIDYSYGDIIKGILGGEEDE